MNRLVTDYLDHTAECFPNKIAFIDKDREVAFAELQHESLCIAEKLIEARLHKSPVLIFMEKSISMISSFMGVAYSGNFYSPVDTKMPVERIHKIVETLNPCAVITDAKHSQMMAEIVPGVKIFVFDKLVDNRNLNIDLLADIKSRIIDTDILYVLFTSGSTGTPKGVIINHRSVVDFVDWISDEYQFDETTIFANQAQLYFDLSIQDVYAPLRNGSTTVLIPNRLYASPVRVWKVILKYKVNTLVWIPSMLSLFANLDILEHVEHALLKTVIFCGEVMPMKQLNYWISRYPKTTFVNLYGPTECTEACTYYTVDRKFADDDILPMGVACRNSEALLIDEKVHKVTKPGIIGELCMRGTCLSMGYYGNHEKTLEVFVQNPLQNNYPEIVYKTGDLACYNEYQELVYVSRKDFQIKIKGYRVELGEIEAAAAAIKEITYNCCLFKYKEEKLLMVYTGKIDPNTVKQMLSTKLQNYMVPTEYIKLEKMIFNMNGKIDRKELMKKYVY